MKTAILFDLDGTLLDTLDDIVSGVNHTLQAMGYPLRTKEEVRRFVGNGARYLMRCALGNDRELDAAVEEFESWYSVNCQVLTKPYDGIPAALAEIAAEHPVAIVSNKPDSAVKPLCSQYFPGIYARGESADCPRKPAPDMIFRAMEALGADRCVYVGDSEVDVQTAKNAGISCLSVVWGFRDRQTLAAAGAEWFCDSPRMLPDRIREML